jgi:hypothetical protein
MVSLIVATLLHLPFRPVRAQNRRFMFWVWLRICLVISAIFGILLFKFLGGYEDFQTSGNGFSPIGTDEKGLFMIRFTAGVAFFIFISICELSYVLVKRRDSR